MITASREATVISTERTRKVSFSDDTLIEHAIVSEDIGELHGILNRQSGSPNSIVIQGECPLHVSVKKNRAQSTKVILEQGADVNLQDEDGQSALHYAIANDNLEITGLLLEFGGDLLQLNDSGIVPTALCKTTKMRAFLNDKIFEATMANLQKMFNKADTQVNRMGTRRLSDGDLNASSLHTLKKRQRSRTLSDSGLLPKSCLKKYSAYEPSERVIKETKESQESIFSGQEEKRQKISISPRHMRSNDLPPSNFIVRAIWNTKNRLIRR